MADKVYAVVDLETTGTQRHAGNKIIQFGCAIIEHGVITDNISLSINPEREIPREIVQLTGLNPNKLANAPTFDEVAPTLHQLLTDKIFIAHNVNFDLPFLNEAFGEVGLEPIDPIAIDTVELAQIMLPQAASYRLKDLSTFLNIEHDHPHQADSDAIVTAKIFILLLNQLQQLPRAVLQQLVQLSQYLTRQTGQIFEQVLAQQKAEQLPAYLQEVGQFVIRRSTRNQATVEQQVNQHYPATDEEKRQQFDQIIRPRQSQFAMMDFIHQQVTLQETTKPLIIEAPTGVGKSLGYLFPLSYELTQPQPHRRIVITTSTTVLQAQLYRQAVPLLTHLRDQPISAALLKSASHYLDFDRLAAYLQHGAKNRGTAINEMRIIVWLTQTQTGDLDELQITNYDTEFFQSINHLPTLVPSSRYYSVDFWHQVVETAQTADIVITNNAYLAQHLTDFTPEQNILVIDEAQHFAEDLTASSHGYFSVMQLHNRLNQIGETLRSLFDNTDAEPLLEKLQPVVLTSQLFLSQAHQQVAQLNDQVILLAGQNFIREPVYLQEENEQPFQAPLLAALNQLIDNLDNYLNAAETLEGGLQQQELQPTAAQKMMELIFQNNKLEKILDYLLSAVDHLQDQEFSQYGFYLSLDDDGINYRFNWLAKSHEHLRQKLNQHFPTQIYTGASLAIGADFSYFLSQLGFTDDEVNCLRLDSPFEYEEKVELLLPQETYSPSENGADYDNWLASTILPVLQQTDVQTLILFNSLASIHNVYQRLQRVLGFKREVMAQGITGSNDKIAKRFRLSKNAILLGSQSFWEGIDFPGEQLSLLIITRIPFESPKNPTTHYRNSLLKAENKPPFNVDTLPKAILKLKQGFGRLIRTETDRGIVLMMDERVINSSYATKVQRAFPPKLPKIILPNQQLGRHINDFFNEEHH